MVIGELDTEFINETPYGNTRFERIDSLKKNFEDHGISVQKSVIKGMAHGGKDAERLGSIEHFFENVLHGRFIPN